MRQILLAAILLFNLTAFAQEAAENLEPGLDQVGTQANNRDLAVPVLVKDGEDLKGGVISVEPSQQRPDALTILRQELTRQEMQAQENALRNQMEHERAIADREMEMKLAQMKLMTERNTQVLLAHINNGAKIEVARIGADESSGEQAYMSEEEAAKAMEHPMQPIANAIGQGNAQMAQAIASLVDTINQQHSRPKTVLRDENGKIIGVH